MAPDYDHIIPAKMCLQVMRDRALHTYYRQPQSMLSDARTIFLNAVLYNGEGSPIAMRVSTF